jgi:hypothetical protein
MNWRDPAVQTRGENERQLIHVASFEPARPLPAICGRFAPNFAVQSMIAAPLKRTTS